MIYFIRLLFVFSIAFIQQQQQQSLVWCIEPENVKGDCQGNAKKACVNALNAFESTSDKWSLYCYASGKDKYGSQINVGKCTYGYRESASDRNAGTWNCTNPRVRTWCDNFSFNSLANSYCVWTVQAVLCHENE